MARSKTFSKRSKRIQSFLRKYAWAGTILSMLGTAIALWAAVKSCKTSDEALSYSKERDLAEITPSIVVRVESNLMYFELDKASARLQMVFVKFPDLIGFYPQPMQGNRLYLTTTVLEENVWCFYQPKMKPQSTVEFFRVPVIIDFQAVVEKKSNAYREEHLMYFEIMDEDNGQHHLQYDHNEFLWPLHHPRIVDEKDKKQISDYVNKRFADYATYDLTYP